MVQPLLPALALLLLAFQDCNQKPKFFPLTHGGRRSSTIWPILEYHCFVCEVSMQSKSSLKLFPLSPLLPERLVNVIPGRE